MSGQTSGQTTDTAFVASDLAGISAALDTIDTSAGRVSKSLGKAFSDALVNGKSFQSLLSNLSAQLASIAIQTATKSLFDGITSALGSGLSSLVGGGVGGGPVTAFADGGVVASPTFFSSGGSTGLMGERGAEAIMPLARGPDGKLGVAASGAGSRPVSVVVNIATQDVQSFVRSEAQVSAALARAVARGQRSL